MPSIGCPSTIGSPPVVAKASNSSFALCALDRRRTANKSSVPFQRPSGWMRLSGPHQRDRDNDRGAADDREALDVLSPLLSPLQSDRFQRHEHRADNDRGEASPRTGHPHRRHADLHHCRRHHHRQSASAGRHHRANRPESGHGAILLASPRLRRRGACRTRTGG